LSGTAKVKKKNTHAAKMKNNKLAGKQHVQQDTENAGRQPLGRTVARRLRRRDRDTGTAGRAEERHRSYDTRRLEVWLQRLVGTSLRTGEKKTGVG